MCRRLNLDPERSFKKESIMSCAVFKNGDRISRPFQTKAALEFVERRGFAERPSDGPKSGKICFDKGSLGATLQLGGSTGSPLDGGDVGRNGPRDRRGVRGRVRAGRFRMKARPWLRWPYFEVPRR
jgi:hypothetical protein